MTCCVLFVACWLLRCYCVLCGIRRLLCLVLRVCFGGGCVLSSVCCVLFVERWVLRGVSFGVCAICWCLLCIVCCVLCATRCCPLGVAVCCLLLNDASVLCAMYCSCFVCCVLYVARCSLCVGGRWCGLLCCVLVGVLFWRMLLCVVSWSSLLAVCGLQLYGVRA